MSTGGSCDSEIYFLGGAQDLLSKLELLLEA